MKNYEEIIDEVVGEKGFFSIQEKIFIHKAMQSVVNQALEKVLTKKITIHDSFGIPYNVIGVNDIIDFKNKLNGK